MNACTKSSTHCMGRHRSMRTILFRVPLAHAHTVHLGTEAHSAHSSPVTDLNEGKVHTLHRLLRPEPSCSSTTQVTIATDTTDRPSQLRHLHCRLRVACMLQAQNCHSPTTTHGYTPHTICSAQRQTWPITLMHKTMKHLWEWSALMRQYSMNPATGPCAWSNQQCLKTWQSNPSHITVY